MKWITIVIVSVLLLTPMTPLHAADIGDNPPMEGLTKTEFCGEAAGLSGFTTFEECGQIYDSIKAQGGIPGQWLKIVGDCGFGLLWALVSDGCITLCVADAGITCWSCVGSISLCTTASANCINDICVAATGESCTNDICKKITGKDCP